MKTTIIPAGERKYIHVERFRIEHNKLNNADVPTIGVLVGKKTVYGKNVVIIGTARITQQEPRLECGARAYIITDDEVTVEE